MSKLVENLSRQFMSENPGVTITMVTSDSGDGIAALFNKKTEVAAASRALTPEEEKLAESKGLRLKKITIARDAIVIIVNGKNKVSQLSIPELGRVFSGEVHNWKELGGADAKITIVARELRSGTARYFKQHVLKDKEFATDAVEANSHDAVMKKVTEDPNAIGFLGLATAAKQTGGAVKIVSLKLTDSAGPGVMPSKETMVGDYPLSRPLYLISESKTDPLADKFLQYCLSEPAQQIVSDTGFVSVH
jgi:phosphate transport system substrate-binding protein